MSARDNYAGVRWNEVVSTELANSGFGILCLTGENLKAPWINFEAGALSNAVRQARVAPLLFEIDPKDVGPPLSQFMMKTADAAGILELLQSINDNIAPPEPRLATTDLQEVFDAMWPKLEAKLGAISEKGLSPGGASKRSDRQLLEEAVELLRAQNYRSIETPRISLEEQLIRLSERQSDYRERRDIRVLVGTDDDSDRIEERLTLNPTARSLYQLVFRPIVPTHAGRTTSLEELSLKASVVDRQVAVTVLPLNEVGRNLVRAWMVFEPPLTDPSTLVVEYSPRGLWQPLRDQGIDQLAWDNSGDRGKLTQLSVDFIFPRTPDMGAPRISVEPSSYGGIIESAHLSESGQWLIRWEDDRPSPVRYAWTLLWFKSNPPLSGASGSDR